MHHHPSSAAPPSAAGLALAPVPRQRALTGRFMRAPDEPDAMLLDLSTRLEAAWKAESDLDSEPDDAAYQAAYRKTAAIVDEIVGLPAATVAGLIVKARAFSWCYSGAPEDFTDEHPQTTDHILLGSLVRDLLAIREREIARAAA